MCHVEVVPLLKGARERQMLACLSFTKQVMVHFHRKNDTYFQQLYPKVSFLSQNNIERSQGKMWSMWQVQIDTPIPKQYATGDRMP